MKVLIIPEDFRKDQYILKPIIQAMLKALGCQKAKVEICMDPLLGSVTQALRWERIQEILTEYKGFVDLFLLCVDRDGQDGRRMALNEIEKKAAGILPEGRILLGENAWQEIEVWLLAGHDLRGKWEWKKIRDEVDPKENYFLPFAKERGVSEGPGEGRKTLAQETARNYERIRQLCTEDVANLHDQVQRWMESTLQA